MAQKINQKQYGKKYSTTEQLTGDVWIDGKPIYRKVVDIGALPNATSKNVPHGISDWYEVLDIRGIGRNSVSEITLPFISPTSSTTIGIRVDGADIVIGSNANVSSFSGHVTIEYTKT